MGRFFTSAEAGPLFAAGNTGSPAGVDDSGQHPGVQMMHEMQMHYWEEQNIEDVERRRGSGYSCDPARIKSDGSPPPVTRLSYGVSNSVGREVCHRDYEGVPAAEMWLGESFWAATGADNTAVLRTEWLEKEQVNERVLRIKAWPELFNSDQGEQGLIQKKLRALLFPRDANEEEKALLMADQS